MRGYLAPSLCLAALSFDTRLLSLQNLLANTAFVEQVQELLLLAVQLLESPGVAVRLALTYLYVACGVFPNRYTNCLLLASCQADSCVVGHYGPLDVGGLNVASRAVAAADRQLPNSLRLVALEIFAKKAKPDKLEILGDVIETDTDLPIEREANEMFSEVTTAGSYVEDLVGEIVCQVLYADSDIRAEDESRHRMAAASQTS